MSSNTKELVENTSVALAFAQPSLVLEDSNTVLDEATESETQQLSGSIEVFPEIDLHTSHTNDSIIILDENISFAAQDIAILTEAALEVALASLVQDDSNMVLAETISLDSKVLDISTETISEVASPSLAVQDSNVVLDEVISPETDNLDISTEGFRGLASTHLVANNSNMVLEVKLSTETQKLDVLNEASIKAIIPLATNHSNKIVEVLISRKTQEIAASIEGSQEMASLVLINGASTGTTAPSLATNDVMELDEMTASETRELNSSTEASPDTTSLSLPMNDRMKLEKMNASETQDPAASNEASLDFYAPSLTANAPTAACPATEISSPELHEEAVLSVATPDIRSPHLMPGGSDMVCKLIVEPIESNFPEIPKLPFATEATLEVPPPFLGDDVSVMVSDSIELSSFEIQEMPVSSAAITYMDAPPCAAFGSNIASEPVETYSQETQDPSDPVETYSQETQDPSDPVEASPNKDPILLAGGGSDIISHSVETTSSENQDATSSTYPPPPIITSVEYTDPEMFANPLSISIDTPGPQFKNVPSTMKHSQRAAKNLANETIQLRIGPNNKCVLAHKNVLAKSPFFASLFRKYPVNQQPSQAYHFPHFDTYAFATIVHWLYQNNIRSVAEEYKDDGVFHTTHMVKVYCLCYELNLSSLMNLSIELLGHGYMETHSAPSIEDIDTAYSQTGEWSGLRVYMATWARCRQEVPRQMYSRTNPWDEKKFIALTDKHPDLLKDFERLCRSTSPAYLMSLNPRSHPICWYHEHPKGQLCGVAEQTFETVCNYVGSRFKESTGE